MTFRLLLFSFIVFISSNVVGQITLKNPQICHDGEGYLKCCYDGSYILKFDKGNFKTFSSFDSNLKYSDIDKTLTFYSVDPIDESRDTVQIRLQPHSILITNGKLQKEITSFPSTPSSFDDFHVSPYIVDGVGRGLTFWAGCGRYVVVKVHDWKEVWSWQIVVREPEKRQIFLVGYNIFRKNRIEHIVLQNDSLKYEMSISTTFRSLKKIRRLLGIEYIDSVRINSKTVVTHMPIDHPYWFSYKKNGKINKKRTRGEMKLCNCE